MIVKVLVESRQSRGLLVHIDGRCVAHLPAHPGPRWMLRAGLLPMWRGRQVHGDRMWWCLAWSPRRVREVSVYFGALPPQGETSHPAYFRWEVECLSGLEPGEIDAFGAGRVSEAMTQVEQDMGPWPYGADADGHRLALLARLIDG